MAEAEARLAIGADPNSSRAYSLLALAMIGQKKTAESLSAAAEAVRFAPGESFPHYVLAAARHHADDERPALSAIDRAIEIDPENGAYFELRGSIRLSLREWAEALEDADQALRLDPSSASARQIRAMALRSLGRGGEAESTIEGALSEDPENSSTFSTQGWLALDRGKPDEALAAFREALRLDPTNDWARRGMVQALKARSLFYRWILAYFLWTTKLSSKHSTFFLIGVIALGRALHKLSELNWSGASILGGLRTAFLAFVALTWLATPVSNLFLMLSRFGRMILDREEKLGATIVGAGIAAALGLCAAHYVDPSPDPYLYAAGFIAMALLSTAGYFSMPESKTKSFVKFALAGLWSVAAIGAVAIFLDATTIGYSAVALSFFCFVALTWVVSIHGLSKGSHF